MRIPRRLTFLATVALVQLALFAAFRAAFVAWFRSTGPEATAADLAGALWIGLKFDLRLSLAILTPIAALGWLDGVFPARARLVRGLCLGWLTLAMAAATFLHAVDFGHYDYLRERLNAGLLEHVIAWDIAWGMVRETYPVAPVLLGFAAFVAAYGFVLRRLAFRGLEAPEERPLAPWPRAGAYALAAALAAGGAYGKWSWYPLRWSDAFFSTDPFVSAVGLNPVLYLADTLSAGGKEYHVARVREHYDWMAGYLGVERPDREKLSFAREVRPERRLPRRPNVVVVFMESFAAFKAGVFGNPLGATPNFDAIARKSIFFKRFMVARPPTARSIFTSLFGIPDVSDVKSSSRNPLAVRQHTIVNAFDGWRKLYFIGGSASWGNIRGMLTHNIPGLELHEEGDFSSPRNDVWGISDLHLLEEAAKVFSGLGGAPFVAYIQLAGNHRPYTIPEDSRGFEPVAADDAEVRRHGFQGVGDLNAMRFMDHSIGQFFRSVEKEPWFRDTIFVMHGDHGTRGAPESAWEELGLTSHHVPCVIYAPGFFPEGREVDRLAGNVDILPTVAALAGVPYLNTTLGRDAFGPLAERGPGYAFVDNGHRRGILDDEFFYWLDAAGNERLFRWRAESAAEDVRARFPEKAAELGRVYRAFFETARYMLYHNRPAPAPSAGAGAGR